MKAIYYKGQTSARKELFYNISFLLIALLMIFLFGCSSAQTKQAASTLSQIDTSIHEIQSVQLLIGNPAYKLQAPSMSYGVRRGDTLWSIAKNTMASPFEWPAIWKASRDEVVDPDWIEPGQNLTVPLVLNDADRSWATDYAKQAKSTPAVSHAEAKWEK